MEQMLYPLMDCWRYVRFWILQMESTLHQKNTLSVAKNATILALKNRSFLSLLAEKFNKIGIVNLLIYVCLDMPGLSKQFLQ
ncbi:hypothetical protein T11_8629 [Trichinella zimbabwensis]|uniref:Uncharacterized protein n=1 Tax=Trichinella zimbabwensis TaxID=268475 RepID=A0A0V1I990_9BILA|nr:hypothetical protein T11_8629 [Trichinella zimbabwensis]